MKINVVKQPNGVLVPASDLDAEALKTLENGNEYQVSVIVPVNPVFFRKLFKLFRHAFAYWKSDLEFRDERSQFEYFRKELVKTAGFVNAYYALDGSVRVEAKSLAWDKMSNDQLRQVYDAVLQAALTNIFTGMSDQDVYREMAGFM